LHISKELNEKLIRIENESKKTWEENTLLKNEIEELTHKIYL
jgi:hypothetical protein